MQVTKSLTHFNVPFLNPLKTSVNLWVLLFFDPFYVMDLTILVS